MAPGSLRFFKECAGQTHGERGGGGGGGGREDNNKLKHVGPREN